MRNRSHLALMELLVMIAVFALAAALCLQIFVFSDLSSARGVETDKAAQRCQNAADILKSVHGDRDKAAEMLDALPNGDELLIGYDANWLPCPPTHGEYTLHIRPLPEEYPGLGKARVEVYTADGEALFSLPAAWQEVGGDG